MLTKFKDWEPSGWDSKDSNYIDWGSSENYSDWLVGPSKTRDATLLEQCNFDCILEELGGEKDNVEVHRFRHWACGHYDLILVRPDTEQALQLENIAEALENIPVFDESAYRELETNATIENIAFELPEDLLTDKDKSAIAAEVWDWFEINDPEQLENRDDQGGYPETELIRKALKELGYHSKAEVEREQQEDLMAEIYPDDFLCCGNHHEREHSQDG